MTSYQTIQVWTAGAIEYTWPMTMTEITGKDIHTDAVVMSLGTDREPGNTWITPDVITWDTDSSVTVQLLIGGNGNGGSPYKPPQGTYGLWIDIADSPENVPRLGAMIFIR